MDVWTAVFCTLWSYLVSLSQNFGTIWFVYQACSCAVYWALGVTMDVALWQLAPHKFSRSVSDLLGLCYMDFDSSETALLSVGATC